jgi:hypothetical protein
VPEKRSPFPRPSLPQAGESARDRAIDLYFDWYVVYATMALTIAAVAGTEWLMRWLKLPLSPLIWTAMALGLGAFATWRWLRIRPQLANLRLAIRGERDVGRRLEELRKLNYVAFHDLPGGHFNVDHVLVGPGGVFAIETKALSKPTRRRAEVHYDGTRVIVDGNAPDRVPLIQAEASAGHVRELLKKMTGRDVYVRPVVLYPEWWVSPQPRNCNVWVLNPKALRAFLQNEPQRLSPEDIALYSESLTLHLSSELLT